MVEERASASVSKPLRVGNCSGFYGDRLSAMRELLEGGDVDVITGDYLAELTMLILGKDQLKDPSLGYARTFVKQVADCLELAMEQGVRIVANAGGLNPAGLVDEAERGGRGGRGRATDRVGRRRQPRAAGIGARARRRPDGERLPRRLRDRPCARGRRRHRRDRPGHGCLPRRRPGDLEARLEGRAVRRARRCRGGRSHHRVRHPGDRRQLLRLPRPAARRRAAGVPDRRDRRRRQLRDHQARRHRWAGLGRHGHGAADVRGAGRALPRPRRDGRPHHHRARRRRRGPGAGLRRTRSGAAGAAEGVRQRARRVPQPDGVRADRPRHRGQGGVAARASSKVASTPPR